MSSHGNQMMTLRELQMPPQFNQTTREKGSLNPHSDKNFEDFG